MDDTAGAATGVPVHVSKSARKSAKRAARGLQPRTHSSRRVGLPRTEYARYIQSPEWRAVRKRFIASKLTKVCAGCGAAWGRGDHLHHRTYKRLGREWLLDLVPLCQPCHTAVHRSKPDRRGLWHHTEVEVKRLRRQVAVSTALVR